MPALLPEFKEKKALPSFQENRPLRAEAPETSSSRSWLLPSSGLTKPQAAGP